MIKKNWMTLAVLLLSILALIGYRVYDGMRTDTAAPEIHMDTEVLELSATAGKAALLQGVTATDDRDGDVTASLVVEGISQINDAHEVTVTYAAFDGSGNVAKATRTARYTDYTAPRFVLSRPLAYASGVNFDILAAVGAEDVMEGDISHRIKATSLDETTVTAVGTHTISFRVTNSLGDTAELVLPVEVYTERYNAQLTLTEYLVYLKAGEKFDYRDYLDTFTAQEEVLELSDRIPADISIRTVGSVDMAVPGVYALSVTATLQQGNQEYVAYTRLIVVVEE